MTMHSIKQEDSSDGGIQPAQVWLETEKQEEEIEDYNSDAPETDYWWQESSDPLDIQESAAEERFSTPDFSLSGKDLSATHIVCIM